MVIRIETNIVTTKKRCFTTKLFSGEPTVNWTSSTYYERQKYGIITIIRGIGGHLFAIVCDKSVEYGKDGRFYGFAANEKLLEHYINVFNAMPVKRLHPYHFIIDEESADAIRKEYTYEWTDEEV